MTLQGADKGRRRQTECLRALLLLLLFCLSSVTAAARLELPRQSGHSLEEAPRREGFALRPGLPERLPLALRQQQDKARRLSPPALSRRRSPLDGTSWMARGGLPLSVAPELSASLSLSTPCWKGSPRRVEGARSIPVRAGPFSTFIASR
ncbi:MAG: hypothetical protein ACI4SG_04725 [Oligosphaeraceae bacterium]